jgi:cation diffusion facilitator family transporter
VEISPFPGLAGSRILSRMPDIDPTTAGLPGPSLSATAGAEAERREGRVRLRAALISFGAGTVILGVKFWAYHLTLSTAVLTDALESIVNVVAAVFAIGGVVFAGKRADRSHPYGHGKIEFFSAAFEGGLIAFAAVLVIIQAVRGFVLGGELKDLDLGLMLVVGAGTLNGILGWFLVRTGKQFHSLTLAADGKHVLSDFWTSAGVVVGLLLVRLTGVHWIDPLVAGILGLNLGWTGWKLVRQAAGGLLDEEDAGIMRRLVTAADADAGSGIIRMHSLRAIRAGRFVHIDTHIVVPGFWDVTRAHDATDAFEQRVIQVCGLQGEIVIHTDPCRQLYCAQCDLPECPVRREPFRARPELTVEEAVHPDPPLVLEP